MHSNLAGWLERIEKGTLPALPQSAEALTRLLQEENTPLSALALVVERDPGLTVALLRRVRSLRTRRLNTEITTVEHALMLLGLGQVRLLFPTVPLISSIADEPLRDRLLMLYARGNQAAWFAREWARLRKDIEPDEVQTAALLHELAEMLLWLHAPAEMGRINELLNSRKEMPAHEAQYVVLGFNLEELTAQLAERWGLPSLVHESLAPENAPSPRVTGIMLATHLARAAERGWYTAETTDLLEQIAAHLRFDFDATVARIHRLAAEAARAIPCDRITPSAAGLLFPSQPEAERGHTRPAESDLCLAPQPHLLRQVLHQLQSHEAGGMEAKEVLRIGTEAMHEAIGLNRVLFASLGKDRSGLKARNVVTPDHDPKFAHFDVELRDGNLFEQLMHKPQSLWMNETNRETFARYLPATLMQFTDTDNFFAMSLFVGSKPLGLLYADRFGSSCALDATAYHQFKQLGLQMARTLAGALQK